MGLADRQKTPGSLVCTSRLDGSGRTVAAANKARFFPPFLGRISLLEEKAIDNGNKDNDVSITSARHGRNEKEEQKCFIVIYIYSLEQGVTRAVVDTVLQDTGIFLSLIVFYYLIRYRMIHIILSVRGVQHFYF